MRMNCRTAALGIWLFGAVAFAGQSPVLLRRQLSAGSTEKYQVDMKMTTVLEMPGGLGEQELGMTSSANLEIKIGKMNWQIPGASIDAVMTVTAMEAEGIMAGTIGDKIPPPLNVKGTLDIYGRLKPAGSSSEGGMDLGQVQSLSFAMMAIELPEKAVSLNDTWPVLVPRSTMTKKNQFLTATLKGERNGLWVVQLSGKYQLEMEPREISSGDGATNPMAGQKVGVKGEVTVEGEGLVDKVTGRTMSLKTKTLTKQVATLASMGVSIDSHSTMDSSIVSK